MNKRFLIFLFSFYVLALSSCADRVYTVNIYATNDVHGSFFSAPYTDGGQYQLSLSNVSSYIKSCREEGNQNVVLLDVGDNLQGDNAAYYFNYVDTARTKHFLSRAMEFMKYDAVVLGNHDIETGHLVYDRIDREMTVPYLAANAVDSRTGKAYFQPYAVINRRGVKLAVIGMENPNIHKWLAPGLWTGIEFKPIYEMLDSLVNVVRVEENPDLIVLAIHAGIGSEDEYSLENPALYIAKRVKGIDAVFAAHDHKYYVSKVFNGQDSITVIEAGSKCNSVSNVNISFKKRKGVAYDKKITASLIDMADVPSDPEYDSFFSEDFNKVKAFTNVKIGYLTKDIIFNESMYGMSDYLNIIHLAQLSASGTDISISAPLSTHGTIEKGDIIYKDLFDFYRFENQLYVLNMTGSEIKDYLEASYDSWVQGRGPSFNYDSAAGINYTVSRSAKYGNRVKILSMAGGKPFYPGKIYTVAMTSYRASGAGDLLSAANIKNEDLDTRIIKRYPEIRELLYQYILQIGTLDPDLLSKDAKLGRWNFVK